MNFGILAIILMLFAVVLALNGIRVEISRAVPKANAHSVLSEVRAVIDECSYMADRGTVCERIVCNKFDLIEKLKTKFGSEHFR